MHLGLLLPGAVVQDDMPFEDMLHSKAVAWFSL